MAMSCPFVFKPRGTMIFNFLFLCVCLCIQNVKSQQELIPGLIPIITDGSVTDISLNSNSSQGPSYESIFKINPNTEAELNVTVPPNTHFVVLQVHSHLKNVTLAHNKIITPSSSVQGTNVGLVKIIYTSTHSVSFFLAFGNFSSFTNILITAQAYGIEAPIPGGCNMEFPVEISPFLNVSYDQAITDVSFAPASPPMTMLKKFWASSSSCDIKPSPVEYSLYRMYVPERDFSEETYFGAILSMLTIDRINQNGVLIREKLLAPPLRRLFASYPGTGSVYVVVARVNNESSIYIPGFTYDCDASEENNTCQVLTDVFSKIVCAVLFFLGLLICFSGHYFFKSQLFLLGFFPAALVTDVVLSEVAHSSSALVWSIIVGAIAGLFILLIWCCCCGSPVLSVILATIAFGYIFASMVFYPLVDAVDVLESDINYWTVFSGIIVFFLIVMMLLSEKANIISCSVLGSYVAIVPIDHYIGANLRYIIINTIRRATIGRFKLVVINPPFQIKDMMLSGSWIILILLGIWVQMILVKKKPPFPAPDNTLRDRIQFWRSGYSSLDESSPLIPDYEEVRVHNSKRFQSSAPPIYATGNGYP